MRHKSGHVNDENYVAAEIRRSLGMAIERLAPGEDAVALTIAIIGGIVVDTLSIAPQMVNAFNAQLAPVGFRLVPVR